MTLAAGDLRCLKTAETIADNVWKRVARWGPFARDTLGKPLVMCADAIGANLAEAFGLVTLSDRLQRFYAARGNVYETKYWLNRAQERELLDADTVAAYADELSELARQLNDLAAAVRGQRAEAAEARVVRELEGDYQASGETAQYSGELFSVADLAWLLSRHAAGGPQPA